MVRVRIVFGIPGMSLVVRQETWFLQAHVIYEVIALPEGVARVADEFWLHAQIGCADGIIREVPLNRAEMRPLSEGWQLGQHSARASC